MQRIAREHPAEGVGGLVLIEGKFRIEPDGEYYKYVYKHPVVNYLPNQHAPVTISTRIRSASIEEPFKSNYAELSGQLISIKIYGEVLRPIDRANNIWDLRLTALAIY